MPVQNQLAEIHAQKEARERRRISLSEVARETKVSRQTITAWYGGSVKYIYFDVLAALCAYYGCSIGDLLVIMPEEDEGTSAQVLVGVVS